MIHQFTILIPEVSDEQFDRIAGECPDTLSGVSDGQAYVDFARDSITLGAAIDSAIGDLAKLGISPLGVQVNQMAGVA